MKKLLPFLFLLFFLPSAAAETLPEALENGLSQLDLTGLESAWQAAFPEGGGLRDMLERFTRGEAVLDGATALRALFTALMQTLSQSLFRMAHLMAPAVLCALAERLRSAFSSAQVGEALNCACFMMLTAVMARDLFDHMRLSKENVDAMAGIMQALFPLLLTLLAAVGSTASAAFFQPATVAASGVMCAMIHRITLPLALSSGIVSLLDRLSPRVRLSRLSGLMKTMVNWTLGVGFTVFLSVTALQAMGAAAADGVSLRTAKYVVDHFVPVVGGMFADTMDTLVGASLLIKNAVGVTGLAVLLATAAAPMMQTLCAAFVYRACAALLEPVSDSRISTCVHQFSQTLMMFFVIELSVGAMFVLLTAQMLAVGQLTVMLR